MEVSSLSQFLLGGLVLEPKNSMMYFRALTPRLRFGTPERRPV